jgi:hypothetical protein
MGNKQSRGYPTVLAFSNHPPLRIYGKVEDKCLASRSGVGFLRANRNQNGQWLLWFDIRGDNEFIGIFPSGTDVINTDAWQRWNERNASVVEATGRITAGMQTELDRSKLAEAQMWLEKLGLSTIQDF